MPHIILKQHLQTQAPQGGSQQRVLEGGAALGLLPAGARGVDKVSADKCAVEVGGRGQGNGI